MKKKFPNNDPNASREAEKYENPIPSREFIMELLDRQGEPMERDAISKALKLKEPEQKEALRRRLRAMERDGQLIFNRRGGYCLTSKLDMLKGRVIGHPDGFGFLVPDEGGDDLFLSAREMRSLFDGDRIVASVVGIDRRGRREGKLVEVLERAHKRVVGRFFIDHGIGSVTIDNKRINQEILVPAEWQYGAQNGQIVTLEIVEFPTTHRQGQGRVSEILGDHMAPGMEIDIAIRNYSIPEVWPQDVETEIKNLSPEVPEEAKQGREDIRHLPLVTIDGEDARDFDDAVYCEPHKDGWRLYVAIADVSSYVKPGSALDSVARERGTSVYFPERVIPMLPEVLSNGLCSINPNVDRLCMVSELYFDADGKVVDFRFFEGVMRSHARLTYNKVAAMLVEGDKPLREEYSAVLPHLEEAHRLFQVLRKRRSRRGAIDFDTTETRIVFSEERKIERIVPVHRNDAHILIEEFMIAANVAAAQFLLQNEIVCLFRVHNSPSLEKLEGLRAFLAELGLQLQGGDKPEPRHYRTLLLEIGERPDFHLIQTVMLRSLKQAVYTPDNEGHFGLAFDAYTHFTSPIRRYPDLLVHRAIRAVLARQRHQSYAYDYDMKAMLELGEHCSMTERRADDATRDVVDWLKCEYMQDKVGESYEGIITAVTSFGIFVELNDIYVEGLVHVTALDNDYYHFDPLKHRLMGERSNRIYRLGDPIEVRVSRVDLEERKIDFVLKESAEGGDSAPAKDKGKKGKKSSKRRRGGKRGGAGKAKDKAQKGER